MFHDRPQKNPILLALIIFGQPLRSSRLASIHIILLDIALENKAIPDAIDILQECILDPRLYQISGTDYQLEKGLRIIWPILDQEKRSDMFNIIRNLLSSEQSADSAKYFLLRLPATDLPSDLQSKRPEDSDNPNQTRSFHRRKLLDHPMEWESIDSDDFEIDIGRWPKAFDPGLLKSFARIAHILSKNDLALEKLKVNLADATTMAETLLPSLQIHSDLLEDNTRFWIWHGLKQILARSRKVPSEPTGSIAGIVLGCANLALSKLEDIPAMLPGSLPKGGWWSGHRETSWENALRLADEALISLPASESHVLQSRFTSVIKAAFATENPMMQLVCATRVQPFHWFQTEERRKLHHDLVWNKSKHGCVLSWSLSATEYSPDAERARIFRLLLNRSDLIDPGDLAESLGRHIGNGSMRVLNNGQRSAVAEVARDAISSPRSFFLLKTPSHLGEFLRSLIFEMKEQAKLVANRHPHLANDYGYWSLSAWRILHAQRKRRNESEVVILQAMHWLQKMEEQNERGRLKVWWEHLQPLFTAVIQEGGRPDCFTFFFQLREGAYNDLTSPEEMLRLVQRFIERLQEGAQSGTMDLDQRIQENDDYYSWRDCAEYSAEAIDSLRNDGSLSFEWQKEEAHRLLSMLATDPIRSSRALHGLYHLHNE